jgi:hypothetical protein
VQSALHSSAQQCRTSHCHCPKLFVASSDKDGLHKNLYIEVILSVSKKNTYLVRGAYPPSYSMDKGKSKGIDQTGTDHKGSEEEQMYSSTLSITSALDGLGGKSHAPAALPPVKTRYSAG